MCNTIDPLDMIKKYGKDGNRLSLEIGSTPGNDMNLSEDKVAGYRNFANKLWNISRYIITNYELTITNKEINQNNLTSADYWILLRMCRLIILVKVDLDNYRFSQAGERLREFTWDDLADWYLEASKFEQTKEKEKILAIILNDLLKLWHPFIPFVTEAIWKELGHKDLLMISRWPDENYYTKIQYENNVAGFNATTFIVKAIRDARAQNKVEPAKKIKAVIYAGKNKELIESQAELIKSLRTGINELEIKDEGPKIKDAIYITVGEIEIYLIGAVDKEKEKERIKKEKKEKKRRVCSFFFFKQKTAYEIKECDWSSDVCSSDLTMHYAAMGGDRTILELIIASGGKINVKAIDGTTPLHYAAMNGQKEACELLIAKGANAKAVDARDSKTALHYAVINGHAEVTRLLIPIVGELDVRDKKYGFTLLHIAALQGHKDVAEVLLKSGAEVNAKSDRGFTPMFIAGGRGNKEVVKLLQEHGGH